MQKSKIVNSFLLVVIVPLLALSVSYSDGKSVIPDWIKNNAKWWSEGTITESDYISGLQYLISQGIIKIPVKSVTATDVSLSDDERAQSFVVNLVLPDKTYTFYTFSKLSQFGQTIGGQNTGGTNIPTGLGGPQFQLESLPSKDKKVFYKLVAEFINPGKKPEPFDVKIDLITGDGTLLQTLQYSRCEITSYWVYTNDLKDEYRLAKKDAMEIRDVANFFCTGFSLKVP